MALKANTAYELVLVFTPPLTHLSQYRDLCRKTCGDRIQLVRVSPSSAAVLVSYETPQPKIGSGTLLFKVGGASSLAGKTPVSSAIVSAITKPSIQGA